MSIDETEQMIEEMKKHQQEVSYYNFKTSNQKDNYIYDLNTERYMIKRSALILNEEEENNVVTEESEYVDDKTKDPLYRVSSFVNQRVSKTKEEVLGKPPSSFTDASNSKLGTYEGEETETGTINTDYDNEIDPNKSTSLADIRISPAGDLDYYKKTNYNLIKDVYETDIDRWKDAGIGTAKGFLKFAEGIITIPLAAAEITNNALSKATSGKIDLELDGAVKNFSITFNGFYENLGETETLIGGLMEPLVQFLPVGIGSYKLFEKIIKTSGVTGVLLKGVLAETSTVGLVSTADDPNFGTAIAEIFKIDTSTKEGKIFGSELAKQLLVEIATPSDTIYNANDVFSEKFQAMVADGTAGGILLPGAFELIKAFSVLARATFKKINSTEFVQGFIEGNKKAGIKIDSDNFTKLFDDANKGQSISSANTDVNFNRGSKPAIYNNINNNGGWIEGTTTLEIGSGKGRVTDKYLEEKNITNLKFDPYRLSPEENAATVSTLKSLKETQGGVDTVIIANVLNVIEEEKVRKNVLKQAYAAIKDNGVVYIDSYNSGKKGKTKLGFQLARNNVEYIKEIESVFGRGSVEVVDKKYLKVIKLRKKSNG